MSHPHSPEGIEKDERGTPVATAARRSPIAALKNAGGALENRDFRVLLVGVTGHSFTLWMEILARNWLVWELTGSPVALGLINFWRTIPVLFLAIPAGVVADRVDRKLILIVTQALILAVYGVLLVLLIVERLEIWHAYVLFALRGVAIAFNQPPRQALIPTLVKPGQVANAVALQQLLFNGTRIAAPLLAGFLFVGGGAKAAFAVIVGIEVLIIIAWLMLRVPPLVQRLTASGQRESAARSTVEGLSYVAHHRVVLLLLLFGLLSLLLFQPWAIMLPVMIDDKFGIGAAGYGTFLSLNGVGSVVGPAVIAFISGFRAKGAIVVGSMMLSGLVMMGLAGAPFVFLAMGLVILLGVFDSAQRVLTSSLLLTQTDRAFHGRVVSLYLLDRGFVPIGSLVAGYMAESFSASIALAILGGTLVVAVALLAAAQPRFLTAK